MKREDAIAAYGHHFTYFPHNGTIIEQLGPHNPASLSLPDSESARTALQQAMKQDAEDKLARLNKLLTSPGHRLRLLGARLNLHMRSEKINNKAAFFRTKKHELLTSLKNNFADIIKIEYLPETLKIPHALEIGQEIHIVRTDYRQPHIHTSSAKITARTVWPNSFKNGDWDYIFTYRARDEKGHEISFEYNKPENNTPEIDNEVVGCHYFLSREAAEDHILALATRMAAQFNQVALEYKQRVQTRINPPSAPRPPQQG